jgi:hypothetical protein
MGKTGDYSISYDAISLDDSKLYSANYFLYWGSTRQNLGFAITNSGFSGNNSDEFSFQSSPKIIQPILTGLG